MWLFLSFLLFCQRMYTVQCKCNSDTVNTIEKYTIFYLLIKLNVLYI